MRRFFSSVFYLCLGLPLALSTLILFGIRPWALDRDFYVNIVTDERLYAVARSPELARDMDERLELEGAVFDGPRLVAAAQKRLPEAELKALGVELIDQGLAAAAGRATGEQSVDLRPLKKALHDRVAETAGDYVRALPRRPELPPPEDYSYLQEGAALAKAETAAAAALERAVNAMPDAAELPAAQSGTSLTQLSLDRATFVMATLSALFIGGLALMGGGLSAAALSRAAFMIGLPSAFVLGIGALLALPGAAILEKALPPEARELLSGGVRADFRAFLGSVLGRISRSFFLTGLVGASIAGLLGSLRRIFEPREL